MRKYLFIVFILFAAFPFAVFAGGQGEDPNAPFNDHDLVAVHRVHMREVFRVGVIANNQPFSYQDAKGVWQGEDITIAKRITKEILGTKASYLRIVPVSASDWVQQLNGDKVDIILGFSPAAEGADGADFSIPYPVSARAAVAVRKGNAEMVLWLNDVLSRRIETSFWK
jgi:polar amino acid transport system substrate-binding protein